MQPMREKHWTALLFVGVGCFFVIQTNGARAAPSITSALGSFNGFLTLFSAIVFVWAFFIIRRLTRAELRARLKVSELEASLNEAEAAFSAEAHVLLVWRNKEQTPQKIYGDMYDTVHMPATISEIMDFDHWLEDDSTNLLDDGLRGLRNQGKAFNFGIKTKSGEILEVDGRAAGGLATLRFRPLAGERQQLTELSYDARKLGFQVERLSAVLDAAPLPIWLRDSLGRLNWVNQAYVHAVERTDSDTVLRNAIEIADPDQIDRAKADPQIGLLGRTHAVFAGTKRALNIYEVALAQGNAGFAVDVSVLETAEKELSRHVEAHASTLNKLTTAIAIFGPDQRLRFHNNAYAKLWPIDEEWLAHNPTDSEILDRLRSQRCLPEQANYREWRAKQLDAYTTIAPRETWWYLPDGRTLHVICEQHPFGGVIYLYENVTKEIQLESRYNEMIGVQRETLDNLDEAITLFGTDGRLKLFNPAFSTFWAFEPSLLQDEPHIDLIVTSPILSGEAGTAWQEIKYAITGLESERKPLRGKLTIGERILQYSSVPLADGNTLLTFSDITDPAKIERALRDRTEALEAADRLKNAFLSNVSYEIRTPLTSILGFAETLELGLVGPLGVKQREYVLDIKKSSEDLKAIIDAIIDLSALDAGAIELHIRQVDVGKLLLAVAEKMSPRMANRDQMVTIEMANGDLSMVGDETRIGQVIANLLSNAIGFSERGSQIRIGARKLAETVQIWVSDSGHGIEPEFQPKVFDRFQSRPKPGSHRGPGLGLSIVKSFTELHGGHVSLISKPGQGTTVVCTFPIAGPPPGTDHTPSSLLSFQKTA